MTDHDNEHEHNQNNGDQHQGEQHDQQPEDQQVPAESTEDGADESAEESDTPTRRATVRRRGNAKQFDWDDVESMVRFSAEFDTLPDTVRRNALGVFNLDQDASTSVDLAQALYPSGGAIEAFAVFADFARKVNTGTLGFPDAMALPGRIADESVEFNRHLTRIVGFFSVVEGTEPKQYRANLSVQDIATSIFSSISNPGNRVADETLDGIDGLLEIWPGV